MSRNRTKAATIAFVLMLTIATTFIICLPAVNPAQVYPTYAFITVSPNPIGVGQSAVVSFWLDKVPPSAGGGGGDRWQGMIVTITKPDTTTQTMGPYTSDPVGAQWFAYAPATTGNYTFQFSFPGQSFPDRTVQVAPYYPPTFYPAADYQASTSPKVTLVVQQEPIQAYPEWPLPGTNEYWQRPINSENRQWYTISGNWLIGGYNATANRFNPYTTAPKTAHIVWTKPISFGGIAGGASGTGTGFGDISYYEGETYEPALTPPVIINGLLYYNTPFPPRYGFYAVDLRTGQTLWYQNTTTNSLQISGFYVKRWGAINLGQLVDMETPNQHGVIPYLWGIDSSGISTMPVSIKYHMYDAFTGNWILDVVNASAGTPTLSPKGDLLVYVLNGARNWLALWNSSKAIPMADISGTGAWQWRPDNKKLINWRDGLQWNVTVPDVPGVQAISKITPDVILAATGSNLAISSNQTEVGYSARTGQQLWAVNRTLPAGTTAYGVVGTAGDGVYVEYIKNTMQWYCYDLYTGNKLWGPTEPYTSAWGMYAGGQGGGTNLIAYGRLYATAYDGMVHCYDIKTGDHLWDYWTGSSGFETPYGTWPLSSIGFSIADGKFYACSGEHSPSMALWRGGGLYCGDANTGDPIWKILGWFEYPVIADGYLLALNGGDMQLYCFGKGQTATTVSVPLTTVANGSSVLIQGTVTDQSPGAKGTPCMADSSMSAWMEYLYMQKPMPADATGVPVKLEAFGADGNVIEIGTVTSDAYGNFKSAWTPTKQGLYTIMATFAGSDSYFSSYAATGLNVGPAPTAPEPVEIPAYPDYTPIFLGMTAAIIVVAILVLYDIFRKRK